jgi:hypothetical protein
MIVNAFNILLAKVTGSVSRIVCEKVWIREKCLGNKRVGSFVSKEFIKLPVVIAGILRKL